MFYVLSAAAAVLAWACAAPAVSEARNPLPDAAAPAWAVV